MQNDAPTPYFCTRSLHWRWPGVLAATSNSDQNGATAAKLVAHADVGYPLFLSDTGSNAPLIWFVVRGDPVATFDATSGAFLSSGGLDSSIEIPAGADLAP